MVRKGIKIVAKTAIVAVSVVLLAVLVVPLAVSLVVSVPAVQEAIVMRLAARASDILGARVAVGKISVSRVNHLEIREFYVEDHAGDTLLFVPRVTAPIVSLGLGERELSFGRVKIQGARLRLHKDRQEDQMNISRLVGEIPDGDGTKIFRMRIEEIEADSLTFELSRPYAERRARGVDFSRFVLSGVTTRIEDFRIAGDTVRMNIRSLTTTERTGWRVDNLVARPLVVSRGSVRLTDAEIRSQGSELHVPSIALVAESGLWRDFSEFADSVTMAIEFKNSRVTSDLVGQFWPAVEPWGVTLDEVTLRTENTLGRLGGEISHARTLGTTFAMNFASRGLPHFGETTVNVQVVDYQGTGEDIAAIWGQMTGGLPAGVAAALGRLGKMEFAGRADGSLHDFATGGTLKTDAGTGEVHLKMAGGTLAGRISTAGVDVGKVLNINHLGAIAGVLDVDRSGGKLSFAGDVGSLAWRGRNYTGLKLEAIGEGKKINARLVVHDPALEGEALAEKDGERFRVEANVAKMHVAGGEVAGRLAADFVATTLDDARGMVEVNDVRLRMGDDETHVERAEVRVEGGERAKTITLRSDFADADATLATTYGEAVSWLKNFLSRYTGLVQSAEREHITYGVGTSVVEVEVKEAAKILDVVMPAAAVAAGTRARLEFNPRAGRMKFDVGSQFVEYGGVLVTGIALVAETRGDSLAVEIDGGEAFSGRRHVPHFAVRGAAKGGSRLEVTLGEGQWRMRTDSVGFAGGRLGIKNLEVVSVKNPSQRLTVNGVVGNRPVDTLRVRLRGFDMAPLGGLLPRAMALEVRGAATGKLDIVSARKNPSVEGTISIRDMALGGHQAPPMHLESRPERGGGTNYTLLNERTGDEILQARVAADGGIAGQLMLENIDAALMDPLLGDIVEQTTGRLTAVLTLGGTLKRIKARGYIEVPEFATTVAYTRARYNVQGAWIEVEDSVLNLAETAVKSDGGGEGTIEMRVDLTDLADVKTTIAARADRLLALNTGAGDSETFYGKIVATGTLAIGADRLGTRIDIVAQTEQGTQFHLAPGAKKSVVMADFVQFAERGEETTDESELARRKRNHGRGERTERGGRRQTEVNMTVSATPAAEMHLLIDPTLGPGITARGEGTIDMRMNPDNGQMTMTGDYGITSGKFQLSMADLFNRTFEISPGSSLRWTGAPTDAILAVDASWRVRTSLEPLMEAESMASRMVPVDCIIRLRERLSAPEMTFDVALPSADADARQIAEGTMNTPELKSMQFLSLMTTGNFAMDNSITGHGTGTGLVATGSAGLDILTNQLNNLLSTDNYDLFFRYRPQDNFTRTQLEAGFSTKLWDERLELEIEGNYVENRTQTAVGEGEAKNLAGDVALTWTIDEAGNLKLKAFSRTIDRLNETQGLQENGIGIYYRKNFNRIRDIFRRKKR